MIAILSPAKNLDFDSAIEYPLSTKPDFIKNSQELIDALKTKKSAEIGKLMDISEKLADLNFDRYQNWNIKHSEKNARPAAFAFNGDAYQGLKAETLSADDLLYAQNHLRILSGLYGILRPLDLIQPHRLEMGTSLVNAKGKNLYEFWGNQITDALNKSLKKSGKTLVNVASNEYFKVLNPKAIDARIITCHFKEYKNGEYKTIMTFAKKARGMMTRYIITNRIENAEDLKGFNEEKYRFQASLSSENEWTFTR